MCLSTGPTVPPNPPAITNPATPAANADSGKTANENKEAGTSVEFCDIWIS